MAITQAMCDSFKVELLNGEMDFSGDTTHTYKIALYTSAATLDGTTTAYSATNEVVGTGYTAGGESLTVSQVPTNDGAGTAAYIDFSDVVWTTATITANGALIYRDDGGAPTNNAVAVLAFGGDKTSTAGDFTIQFPAAASGTAIIRIA